jgi:putative DNA primase/helicase
VGEQEGGLSFIAHAAAHGLIIHDLIADGRWHRVPTDDKPRKRNGAYLFDGQRGVVKNFATMQDYAAYRDGANVGKVDKSMLRAQRVIRDAETKAKQDEARRDADGMVKRATPQTHPYLVKKGFPEERGLVLDGELLIPMREFSRYRTLNSLQRISADGSKLFLPGGKAKSSVFFIGPMVANERWLVEGYATGLSVRAALRELHRTAQVIVCFSASNLAHIGRLVRNPSYVMADNDESGAGEKAAKDTGLPFVMPPEVGTDANDMHQRDGLRALANLIRDPVRARAADAA